jgi:hypothetical protein
MAVRTQQGADGWIDGCGPRSPNRSQTQHMGPHPSAAAILPSHRIHCRPNVSLIIRSLAPWRQIDELFILTNPQMPNCQNYFVIYEYNYKIP